MDPADNATEGDEKECKPNCIACFVRIICSQLAHKVLIPARAGDSHESETNRSNRSDSDLSIDLKLKAKASAICRAKSISNPRRLVIDKSNKLPLRR